MGKSWEKMDGKMFFAEKTFANSYKTTKFVKVLYVVHVVHMMCHDSKLT